MNVHEIMQGGKARAVLSCTNKRQREIAEALLIELVAEAYKAGREVGEKEGGANVLGYLEEVYGEGIQETDIWADYMDTEQEEENKEEAN